MTIDDLKSVISFTKSAQDLAGTITILKEKIAWLQGADPLKISIHHAGEVVLNLDEQMLSSIRDMILNDYVADLEQAEAEFGSLLCPVPAEK